MSKAEFCLLLVVLVACLAFASAQQCQSPSFKDSTVGDYYYDLSKLQSDTFVTVDAPGDWKYLINYCKGVGQQCSEDTKDKGKNFKAIQQHKFMPYCYYLAAEQTIDDTKWEAIDKSSPNAGVTLTYTKGETTDPMGGKVRQTGITIKCDEKATGTTPNVEFVREQDDTSVIEYFFEATSQYGCPVKGSGPSNGGKPLGELGVLGLFMILGFVGFLAYFIIGLLVCKFALKKTGMEIIPNVYFWMDFPFLLKDGLMLPIDVIQSLTGRGKYQTLEDPK